MCKHVLYVLILFPASSFSITGPPHGHLESHFLEVLKLCFKLMLWYFCKIIFIYYYFFYFLLYSIALQAIKKRKREKKK